MGRIVERLVNPDNLDQAWRHLRRDRAPWSPEVDGEALRRRLPLHLMNLVRDIEGGCYSPLPVRQFPVRKPDGGKRVLSLYYLRDKFAQRLMQQTLEPLAERRLHADSFGYRPRRGVCQALSVARERIATGRTWLVDADIEGFFDAVPHTILRRTLRRWIPDRDARNMIDAWLAMGPYVRGFMGPRRGLLQGAVLSPLLCNIYLDRMDRIWASANIPFVRFADDFLLFAANREQALEALEMTRRRLAKLGLSLHPRKTRVAHVEKGIRFLGQTLPAKMNAQSGSRARMSRRR